MVVTVETADLVPVTVETAEQLAISMLALRQVVATPMAAETKPAMPQVETRSAEIPTQVSPVERTLAVSVKVAMQRRVHRPADEAVAVMHPVDLQIPAPPQVVRRPVAAMTAATVASPSVAMPMMDSMKVMILPELARVVMADPQPLAMRPAEMPETVAPQATVATRQPETQQVAMVEMQTQWPTLRV